MALFDGLQALYHTNDDWLDSSDNGNDGTASGAIFDGTDEKLGSHCGSFDGVDDYVSASGADLPTGAASRSVSFWLRAPNMAQGNKSIMGWGVHAAAERSFMVMGLGNLTSRKIGFWGGGVDFESVTTLSDDTWYHIVYTYDGTTGRIYINDSLDNSMVQALATGTGSNFYMADLQAVMTPFNCLLDEVAVWDRVITASEITELYNSGAGIEIVEPTVEEDASAVNSFIPHFIHKNSHAVSVHEDTARAGRFIKDDSGSKIVH
jgi:hypothetical protein